MDHTAGADDPPTLRRVIGLPLLILYGLGVTIGAGIYVLIGATAARAGVYAPTSFLVASFVMMFSACSFAELSGRIPQSAGEAIYVDAGFGRGWLTVATGLGIVASAVVAAATIGLGCAGYLGSVIETILGGEVAVPRLALVGGIVVLMGAVALRGIRESVLFAGALTLLEIVGLLVIIGAGFARNPGLLSEIPSVIPSPGDGAAWFGVFGASLIAFFAFIGFDDTVNLVEETRDPARVMPIAIGTTLVLVTVIYFFVSLVAVRTLGAEELAASEAPLGLLFGQLTGLSPLILSIIAVFATMNGIVIQIIMASRVLYGLGKEGHLPAAFARVHPVRRIPRNATLLVTALVLVFAFLVPLERLAEMTSQMILAIFVLINLSLWRIKRRGDAAPDGIFTVPVAIPVFGAIASLLLLVGSVVFG